MVVVLLGGRLQAEDIGCVSTTFRVLGANDRNLCQRLRRPEGPEVTCHLSQARTGGMRRTLGVAGCIPALCPRVSAGRSDHRGSHEAAQRG